MSCHLHWHRVTSGRTQVKSKMHIKERKWTDIRRRSISLRRQSPEWNAFHFASVTTAHTEWSPVFSREMLQLPSFILIWETTSSLECLHWCRRWRRVVVVVVSTPRMVLHISQPFSHYIRTNCLYADFLLLFLINNDSQTPALILWHSPLRFSFQPSWPHSWRHNGSGSVWPIRVHINGMWSLAR